MPRIDWLAVGRDPVQSAFLPLGASPFSPGDAHCSPHPPTGWGARDGNEQRGCCRRIFAPMVKVLADLPPTQYSFPNVVVSEVVVREGAAPVIEFALEIVGTDVNRQRAA